MRWNQCGNTTGRMPAASNSCSSPRRRTRPARRCQQARNAAHPSSTTPASRTAGANRLLNIDISTSLRCSLVCFSCRKLRWMRNRKASRCRPSTCDRRRIACMSIRRAPGQAVSHASSHDREWTAASQADSAHPGPASGATRTAAAAAPQALVAVDDFAARAPGVVAGVAQAGEPSKRAASSCQVCCQVKSPVRSDGCRTRSFRKAGN